MAKFIATDRVAVRDDAGNTVYLRRKMDLGAVSRIQGARPGEQLIALYAANILAWSGPDFTDERGKPVPCTAEQIEQIDPNDPFWEMVGDKIAELNPKKDTVSSSPSMTEPEPSSTASNGQAVAAGIST
jgi:hypothetical protein